MAAIQGAPQLQQVPGLAQHQAQIAQLQQAQELLATAGIPAVPGLHAHRGAELVVANALPGPNPIDALANTQAERELLLLQQRTAAANTFTGLVGPAGAVGPSGLVGPAGNIQF